MRPIAFHRGAFLVSALLVVGSVRAADDRETLGFWTFEGTSGQKVVETRTVTTLSNRIDRTDGLQLDLKWPTDGNAASAPLPTYVSRIQGRYLFEGPACTNRLATTPTSMYVQRQTGGDASGWTKPHPWLQISEVGSLIKDRDWTLEMIVHMKASTGWNPLLTLTTNTANKASIALQTNGSGMVNTYRTATAEKTNEIINDNYKKYDIYAYPGCQANVYINDGRWHHLAYKWVESERKLYLYVDYVVSNVFEFWNKNGGNLSLDDHARFVLCSYNSGGPNQEPTYQAIRLTRGSHPISKWLYASDDMTPAETLAHWRMDGTPGQTAVFIPNSIATNRTDMALSKYGKSYESGDTKWNPYDTTMAYAEPKKPYVRVDGELTTNKSSVGHSGTTCRHIKYVSGVGYAFDETRSYFSIMRGNPALAQAGTGPSFTHEMFVFCSTNNLTFFGDDSDKTCFFAESEGAGGFSSWGNTLNWIVSQERYGSADGKAKIMFRYTYQDDAQTASGVQQSFTGYLTTNEWHHLAVTYDAPTRVVNFYVDYRPAYSKTLGAGYHMTRGTNILGAGDMYYGYSMGFAGMIDEWRITRRALQPSEFLKPTSGMGTLLLVR